jgi:COP9 signalosome complex subunit 6
VFESLIEIVNGEPRVLFSRVQYTLATEEAERIGVDHIARSSISGSTQTSAGVSRIRIYCTQL